MAVVVLTIAALVQGVGPAQAGPAQDRPRTWGVRPSLLAGAPERAAFSPSVAPGRSIDDAVEVSNFSTEPLTLELYAADAFNTADGGFDVLPAAERPTDVGAWVALERSTVTLAPGARQDVPFTITVPADAEPGDHAGGIVASVSTGAVDGAGNPIRLDQRVGTRIYLRVDGPLRPALEVDDLRLRYAGTANPLGTGSATVTFTVRNRGNVRLAATPVVDLEGILGAGRLSERAERVPELLPGGSVTRQVELDGAWPALRLTARVTLRPTAPDGTEVEPVTASAATWAVPWALLAIMATLLGLALLARRQVRRQAAAAPPPPAGGPTGLPEAVPPAAPADGSVPVPEATARPPGAEAEPAPTYGWTVVPPVD